MIIDQSLLDTLSAQAKASPRLRQAYDLRNTPEDNSQRMLNALETGTVMQIHRHRNTSESIAIVRGKMIMRFYDDKGNVTEEFVMAPAGSIAEQEQNSNPSNISNTSNPSVPMIQVEAGQWHSLEVLEEGTVVFEAKDGKYEALKEEELMKLNA